MPDCRMPGRIGFVAPRAWWRLCLFGPFLLDCAPEDECEREYDKPHGDGQPGSGDNEADKGDDGNDLSHSGAAREDQRDGHSY